MTGQIVRRDRTSCPARCYERNGQVVRTRADKGWFRVSRTRPLYYVEGGPLSEPDIGADNRSSEPGSKRGSEPDNISAMRAWRSNPVGSTRSGRALSEPAIPARLPHVLVLGVLLLLRVGVKCMCSAQWRVAVVDAWLMWCARDPRDPSRADTDFKKIGRQTPPGGPIPPKLDRGPREFLGVGVAITGATTRSELAHYPAEVG